MATLGASEEKAFAAERGLAGLRLAIIALNSFVYLALMNKAGTSVPFATTVIILANGYGLGVVLLQPYKRFPVLASSAFTTALDAIFITVWLVATGGLESPFYPLWLVSTTAVAFRYGFRETVLAAAVYIVCDVGMIFGLRQAPGHLMQLVVREAYIVFIAAAGGFFAQESFRQTTKAIEMRRLASALRESEERVRRLSDASFEAITIHDQGRILEANAAFMRIFGYGPEDLGRLTAFDLIDPVHHGRIAARLAEKSDSGLEVRARRKDGTVFEAELTARDFPYEGRTVRVVAIRDITQARAAQRAIEQQAALQATNERLRELDALKTQFINNAAHELGTPLTPIKLQAHLLRSDAALSAKQRKSVDVLSRNVDHLGLMVRDLLDASRLQAGRLRVEPAPVDVHRLAEDAVESFGEVARQAGVSLDLRAKGPIIARADPARVTQVLLNLLANALKFTPRGGRVTVFVEPEASEVVVRVQDTGPGLEPDQIDRLFRPFSQVHDRAQESRSGTGLGLFISKGIVEQHAGRIWAQSGGRGQGSVFAFSLPAA